MPTTFFLFSTSHPLKIDTHCNSMTGSGKHTSLGILKAVEVMYLNTCRNPTNDLLPPSFSKLKTYLLPACPFVMFDTTVQTWNCRPFTASLFHGSECFPSFAQNLNFYSSFAIFHCACNAATTSLRYVTTHLPQILAFFETVILKPLYTILLMATFL